MMSNELTIHGAGVVSHDTHDRGIMVIMHHHKRLLLRNMFSARIIK